MSFVQHLERNENTTEKSKNKEKKHTNNACHNNYIGTKTYKILLPPEQHWPLYGIFFRQF